MQRKNETLVTRLKKGERKAMEELYDTYSSVLLGVSMRYCDSREEAEDMLHESLIKILRGIQNFQETFQGSFEAWMKKIAVNNCLGALRKKTETVRLNGNEIIFQESEEEDDIDLQFMAADPEIVIAMIQTLPVGYRTVLNLFVFEKHTHKEISIALNISESTSKSQLSKARSRLRKKMKEFCKVQEVKK
ncbi:MAG: RNA polymerase sigma factor [Bacteroidales bacterium]|nr:RNA polymerase sigma factor [Bacteroidales bacterium]